MKYIRMFEEYKQLNETESFNKLREIMKNAGIPTSTTNLKFGLNELKFLILISNSSSDMNKVIEAINKRLKANSKPELKPEEIEVIQNFLAKNTTKDIEKTFKEREKEIQKQNKEIIQSNKKGTFTKGTEAGETSSGCPTNPIGLTKFEKELRK